MPVLYMDLDGTILDVWPRYYSVMRMFFERELMLPFPTLQEYRQLKLTLPQDIDVMQSLLQGCIPSEDEVARDYMSYKQIMLESEQMLALDTLIGQFSSFVPHLKPEYKLHLLSVRKNHQLAIRQLQHLGITELLDKIDFVLPTKKYNPKWDAIKSRASQDDVIVGDSEIDITCGTMLQLRTFHVSTGLRSYEYAIRYGHAIQLNDYSEVLSFLR